MPLPYTSFSKHLLDRTGAVGCLKRTSEYLHSHMLAFFMLNKKSDLPFFFYKLGSHTRKLASLNTDISYFFFLVILPVIPSVFTLPHVKKSETWKVHSRSLSILGYCSGTTWRFHRGTLYFTSK